MVFDLNTPSLEEFLNVCSALEAAVGRRDIKFPNKNQFISSLRPNFLSFAACIVLAIVGVEDFLKENPLRLWAGVGQRKSPRKSL
jgi:hypothetical protein